MTVGQRIRAARKRAGLTQKELGEKLGLSFQGVAQWENNLRNPKHETIQRIAKALGVSVDYLIGINSTQTYASWKETFMDNLSFRLSAADPEDLHAADINTERLWAIAEGKIQLSFSEACDITDQLGVSLEEMVGREIAYFVDEGKRKANAQAPPNFNPPEPDPNDEENPWELDLLDTFDRLNLDGQIKAVERVKELTEIPKYQKETPPQDET